MIAPRRRASPLVTTGDVARALHLTREGVRYLVRAGELTCQQTVTRLRLFWKAEVEQVAHRRAARQLDGRLPIRPKWGPRGQPRPMSLPDMQLRLVSGSSVPLDKGQVNPAKLPRNQAGSDKASLVNRRAARC